MTISLFSCFGHCGAIFENFKWRHFLGIFQAFVALLAFALSFGVFRPAGPVTLHAIPAVNNHIWLLTFAIMGIICFMWAIVGVWQLGITRQLEQLPTLFRFWILFDLILELACAGVVTAYIISVLQSSNGCLDRSQQGCSAAWAFTVFEALWVVIEAISFGLLIAKYLGRDDSYERPDRKGEWKIWVRGAQVLFASLSVALAALLYLPTGIPVVDGIRSPNIVWVLLMGTIVCGIFWLWHLIMCFPGIQRSMYGSYGRYVFYVVMECLALLAYSSLGAVYAWKFLTNGSACADMSQKGCPAVLAADAFTNLAAVLQIPQIIALLFMLDERPQKPIKPEKPKKPKQPKQPKQPRPPKQQYQPPARTTYPPESYTPPSYPPETYPPPSQAQQSYAPQSYPQESYTRKRRPQQTYPPRSYPPRNYPPQSYQEPQPPPSSYAYNKRYLDMEQEEAKYQAQVQREREQMMRDAEMHRARIKARRDAKKQAAKQQREMEALHEKERKQEEKEERLRQKARKKQQERLRRLQEEPREDEIEESFGLEDYPPKQPDGIGGLQDSLDKVQEQEHHILRTLERRYQAGPSRQRPQEIPPPPSYDGIAQGQRPHMPSDGGRHAPGGAAPDLLDQVYQEWEVIDEEQQRRARLFD